MLVTCKYGWLLIKLVVVTSGSSQVWRECVSVFLMELMREVKIHVDYFLSAIM